MNNLVPVCVFSAFALVLLINSSIFAFLAYKKSSEGLGIFAALCALGCGCCLGALGEIFNK